MLKRPCRSILKSLALAVMLLSACQAAPQPLPASTQISSGEAHSLDLTQSAVPTATRTPNPTLTATPVPTSSETPAATQNLAIAPTLTLPPNRVYFFNSNALDFVFPADPERWSQIKPADNPYEILTHKTLPGCGIDAVPGRGIGTPKQVLRWQLGRLSWLVYDYGNSALASIEEPQGLFLQLRGHQNAECRADQQVVLADVLLTAEMEGNLAYNPLLTPTPRPPLEGFLCPGAPPTRLRVKDVVHLVSNNVWLRSAPRAEESTQLILLPQTTPYMFTIIEGPVCVGKFVYWQVQYELMGGMPSDPAVGWLAEGDLQEYYLASGW